MVGPGIFEVGMIIQGLLVGIKSLLQLSGSGQGIASVVMANSARLVYEGLGGVIESAIPVQGGALPAWLLQQVDCLCRVPFDQLRASLVLSMPEPAPVKCHHRAGSQGQWQYGHRADGKRPFSPAQQ